ncbi:glycosyltransferase family 9 protein [Streptomyces sp. DSM 44915]|uniref:Glycosyltransferase family 9 protein n=1 Tax=Streptomyces chisholmiae TaxID=3075540 RepID=A0ABU2JNA2_9ACTN|nr:glycosyltransferase family 9 protein [Streptomyces sp. DSM 44915]MDT0266457.1 glycosyltransferase family 9 protein [Streptomyces sp. DSM 44915]
MSGSPRTLVVRLDGAGDVLLAGPALRSVAAGSATTTLLCGPRGAAAGRLLPGVDEVLVYDAPWVSISPPAVRRSTVNELVARLAARRFDRALVFASHGQSPLPAALLLRLSGVPWVAADCEHRPGALLQLRHRRAERRHEAEAALDLAAAAGFPPPPGDEGALAVLDHPPADELTGPGPYLVVHPGGRTADRSWTPGRAERAVAALAEAGHRVVVTGGDDERALTRRVAGRHALDLGGLTELPQLAGVLAGATALVAGATGPAHLAAAVRTPIVCLLPPCLGADRLLPYRVPHLRLGDRSAPSLDAIGDEELLAAVAALTGRALTG